MLLTKSQNSEIIIALFPLFVNVYTKILSVLLKFRDKKTYKSLIKSRLSGKILKKSKKISI